jgi:hypothetical protein
MVAVGDLMLTRGSTWAVSLIRLGAALRDQPNIDNHVAIAHHQDATGTWWAIEGRPGGVGWADAAEYLASPWTTNNIGQPKTEAQRARIAALAEGMLGRPYDWVGIIADAMNAIHAPELWAADWRGHGAPAHVVCSSLACWAYQQVGLAHPTKHEPRLTTPADWEAFVIENEYEVVGADALGAVAIGTPAPGASVGDPGPRPGPGPGTGTGTGTGAAPTAPAPTGG